jgi:hypothetical protein
MRIWIVAAALLGVAGPASACPPREACLVQIPSTIRLTEVDTEKPLPAPPAPRPTVRTEVEMPWIWRVLRERVYARMPRYEQPRELSVVLAPVVVTSPSDTVPGVGLSGAF